MGGPTIEANKKTPVSITFDNGNIIQYEEYFPILEHFKLPATFYIVTSWIDKTGFLKHNQISELWEKGNEIGSHTHTHVPLSNLTNKQLISELRTSKEILNQFNCTTLAYPFGDYSRNVLNETMKYYVGARTYQWSLDDRSGVRYNSAVQPKRFELKAFPIEHVYAHESKSLASMSTPMFKKAMTKILGTAVEKNHWSIFVYHGSREDIGPKLTANKLYSKPAQTLKNAGNSVFSVRSLAGASLTFKDFVGKFKPKNSQKAEEINKFKWLCEFLSSNKQIEVSTVDQIIARLSQTR